MEKHPLQPPQGQPSQGHWSMDLAPYTWSGHDKKMSDSYLPGLTRMMMLQQIVASAWTFVLHLAPLTTPWIDTRPGLYNIDTTTWTRILQSLRPRNSQIRTRGFGALKYWRTPEARSHLLTVTRSHFTLDHGDFLCLFPYLLFLNIERQGVGHWLIS